MSLSCLPPSSALIILRQLPQPPNPEWRGGHRSARLTVYEFTVLFRKSKTLSRSSKRALGPFSQVTPLSCPWDCEGPGVSQHVLASTSAPTSGAGGANEWPSKGNPGSWSPQRGKDAVGRPGQQVSVKKPPLTVPPRAPACKMKSAPTGGCRALNTGVLLCYRDRKRSRLPVYFPGANQHLTLLLELFCLLCLLVPTIPTLPSSPLL